MKTESVIENTGVVVLVGVVLSQKEFERWQLEIQQVNRWLLNVASSLEERLKNLANNMKRWQDEYRVELEKVKTGERVLPKEKKYDDDHDDDEDTLEPQPLREPSTLERVGASMEIFCPQKFIVQTDGFREILRIASLYNTADPSVYSYEGDDDGYSHQEPYTSLDISLELKFIDFK